MKDAGLGRLPVPNHTAFYDHPRYLAALRDRIDSAIKKVANPDQAHLIFSAHGLPSSYYQGGDPYPTQVQETVRLVMRELPWKGSYGLAFQSKVGPVRWLEPSTEQEIHRVAALGIKEVIVVGSPSSLTTSRPCTKSTSPSPSSPPATGASWCGPRR